jgi:hypothetical protein
MGLIKNVHPGALKPQWEKGSVRKATGLCPKVGHPSLPYAGMHVSALVKPSSRHQLSVLGCSNFVYQVLCCLQDCRPNGDAMQYVLIAHGIAGHGSLIQTLHYLT